jgi:hypothetical protein
MLSITRDFQLQSPQNKTELLKNVLDNAEIMGIDPSVERDPVLLRQVIKFVPCYDGDSEGQEAITLEIVK